jgi:hypothetical protein
MSFASLNQAAERLRKSLRVATGIDLIDSVSLEAPQDDASEISFHKSILWGYAFWYEACQPAGRHLLNIVRNTSRESYSLANRAFLDVQNLRTFKAHNLSLASKSDQYKLTQAKVWLAQNRAAESDWGFCINSLCEALARALNILCDRWEVLVNSSEDAESAIQDLIGAINREWPAHLFDRIIEDASALLDLPDLDSAAYRKMRLDDWRRITDLFTERVSAEAAVKRAIIQELTMKFGRLKEA